ncbi:MAG: T9SS type A sorting domain-containing protein [Ignavibacteria bacterium]
MKLSLIYFSLIFAFGETIQAQQVYYPLALGNTWQYEGTYLGVVTKDTIMPNQIEYTVIQYNTYEYEFLRQGGNKIYQYNRYYEQEELLYDFSRSSGDTIFSKPRETDTTDIILVSTDSVEIFGKERLHFIFLIDHMRHAIDDEQWIEIVDSIGPSVRGWAWGFYDLVSAWIDGKYYETVDVKNRQKELSFSISQNYPNPFNPITTITYSLPTAEIVSLKIYDILGREIESLANEFMNAGEHTAVFNASNLSSGIYFYELKVGKYRSVKKMMLLK